jgi:hypothetical protein
MAHTAPRWVPASLATARVAPGLTWPPQAVSVFASPAATRMLRAALASRSWTVPHAEQTQARTFSGLGPSRCPHAEQVWEVGAHGEVLDGDRLVLADQPQGKLVMVVGALVADPTVATATRRRAFALFLDPFCLRLSCRCARARRRSAARRSRGLARVSMVPSLAAIVANEIRPRSIRAVRNTGGSGGRVAFDDEGGVGAAVWLADDGDAGRHPGQLAGPAHAHSADFGYIQPGPVEREAVAGESDRLTSVLRPKPRAPDPAAVAPAGQRVQPVAVGRVGRPGMPGPRRRRRPGSTMPVPGSAWPG